MFHLQISQFRQAIRQYLLLHHRHQVAPQGRLIPAIEEALATLGNRYQIEVTVTAPISTAVQNEHPLKLSIVAQDGQTTGSSSNRHNTRKAQLSIWGVITRSNAPDADRTLRPLFIQTDNVNTESCDATLRGILELLQPGRSQARLSPQLAHELPIAA